MMMEGASKEEVHDTEVKIEKILGRMGWGGIQNEGRKFDIYFNRRCMLLCLSLYICQQVVEVLSDNLDGIWFSLCYRVLGEKWEFKECSKGVDQRKTVDC